MSKVLVIGIDGMDKLMLSKFKNVLPNFSKLAAQSPEVNFSSVFPPDTMPAWISMYTGLNPAKHGIINFIDSHNKKAKVIIDSVDNTVFQGRTFWDVASKAGKKVCIVLPYAVFPAYPVNGSMVCRTLKVVPENFPTDTFPQSLFDDCDLANLNLNMFHGFPSRKSLGKFVESCRVRTVNEADVGLKMLKSSGCDLFFIYMSALDAIQHTFWSYFDKMHPDYPGPNLYENVIRDFYVLFDRIVGEFIKAAGENTIVIVLSDHGHGMRPVKVVNINEVLRRKGYLVPKENNPKNPNTLIKTDVLKSKAVSFVDNFGINSYMLRIMHKFPLWKRFFTSASFIDWNKTIAYVSDLSAIKCYSYCGVIINRTKLNTEQYEHLRTKLLHELAEITDPVSRRNLVKWVSKRENMYQGENISKYPDIILELADDFGAGWDVGVPITSVNRTRNIQPGTHKANSPVLLFSNLSPSGFIVSANEASLMDMAPTILRLLGVTTNNAFDGQSLVVKGLKEP